MNEEVADLLALQETDLEIESIERRIHEIPEKVKGIEKSLEEEDETFKAQSDGLKAKEMRLHSLNVDLESAQEKVRTYENQLLTLSSNTEYKAMIHQIETEKQKVNDLENTIIDLMEEVESQVSETREAKEDLEKAQVLLKEEIRTLEQEKEALKTRLLTEREARKVKVSRVDPKLLQIYDKLRNLRGGEVIVPVNDGACSGCHSKLPIQVITDMKSSARLARCEVCGRLLVWIES
jgi:hypothetical protein